MKSQPERFNDRLEREHKRSWKGEQARDGLTSSIGAGASNRDPEGDELMMVARYLQASPHLQADPDFTKLLENRLLLRHASLRQKQPARRWIAARLWYAHPALSIALGLCLLVLFLGTGVLFAAARVSNPENPLYVVKRWEQGMQVSLARSPATHVELYLQFGRERLSTLASLANPAHADAYQQALVDFEQQMSDAASSIEAISAGPDHDRLSTELATLRTDARRTLRGFLPHLALPERLATTGVLRQVGDMVLRLLSVEIVVSVHPNERATINITGENIQPGAQLLVNERETGMQGSFQNGIYVFTTNWNGDQHPQSIGLLNPDGTAAQTAAIVMKSSNANGNGNSDNGNTKGHENGTTRGKPDLTPAPHSHPTPPRRVSKLHHNPGWYWEAGTA